MVNKQGIIIHNTGHKKGKRHDYGIYKKGHPAAPKQVVSVFDLGYLGGGRDFMTKSRPNPTERRQAKKICLMRKKSTTRINPEKG
jgi:hypothetical protein